MKVIFFPLRFFFVSLLIFFSAPLVAWQTTLYHRAPWWDMPLSSMRHWAFICIVCVFPIWLGLLRAKKVFFQLMSVLAVSWCFISLVLAMITRNWWMGLFTLCLSFFWILFSQLMKNELSRTYMDPQMKWYQGLPQEVAHLKCYLKTAQPATENEKKEQEVKVARIDREGAFIFSDRLKKSKSGMTLSFQYRGLKSVCFGVPVTMLSSNQDREGVKGFGVRFNQMTMDEKKNLGDLIEALQGEGYV